MEEKQPTNQELLEAIRARGKDTLFWALVELLEKKKMLTDEDAQQIAVMEPFPHLG